MEKLAFALVTPLVFYLKDGTLPDSKEVARKLKVQAAYDKGRLVQERLLSSVPKVPKP